MLHSVMPWLKTYKQVIPKGVVDVKMVRGRSVCNHTSYYKITGHAPKEMEKTVTLNLAKNRFLMVILTSL